MPEPKKTTRTVIKPKSEAIPERIKEILLERKKSIEEAIETNKENIEIWQKTNAKLEQEKEEIEEYLKKGKKDEEHNPD